MIFAIATAVAVSMGLAGGAYDISLTSRGLKKGLALESNTWLIGNKPSLKALILRDALVFAFCLAVPAIALALGNVPVAYGALTSPAVFGIKHYLGAQAWKKLGA